MADEGIAHGEVRGLWRPATKVALGALVLCGLYLTSLHSYLLFHSLAELFSVVVACGIFMLAWNSRRFLDSSYLILLGIAYLFVGGLDLLHTLAYKGMGVFQGYDSNLPVQLWIGSRYVEGFSLLAALLISTKTVRYNLILLIYTVTVGLLLVTIFHWGIFPVCYVEGAGLTPFKRFSEYAICLLLVASLVLLARNRGAFDGSVFGLLAAAIVVTIGTELAFTLYTSMYGLPNLVGHFLKIVSFYLVYKAIVETGLKRPYNLLFRNLKRSEEALQHANNELEARVEERTARLAAANAVLEGEIARREQTEGVLRESEERLKGLVDHIPDGVCLVDVDCRPMLANPPAQEYLAVLADTETDGRIVQIGGISIAEVCSHRADGLPHEAKVEGEEPRVFEIGGCAVREGAEETERVLMLRDVTKEREVEQKIRRQYHLASVGQLAAGIAHDFNNMLTVIMGCAQILQVREGFPDEVKEDLKAIYTQGESAAQMIRQILDFSRQTVVDRQTMDLVPFLKEAAKLMERALPETIRISAEFGDRSFPVDANVTQLQQVFTNLAVNARDAMPRGGGLKIGLSVAELGQGRPMPLPGMVPGEWVVWTVSDSGEGIPRDTVAHIYEPFFTTKERGKGTGLGLAQVYGIIKQHNGFIDVDSEAGRGTTFTIYLPLGEEKETSARQPRATAGRGDGRTVLVVEDQPAVLRVVKAMVEGLGYQALTAPNGREALDLFDRNGSGVALVLTDIVMPEMGGSDLLRALRRKNPELPVVMMTGHASEIVDQGGIPGVAAGMLHKPLVYERLEEAIAKVLGIIESENAA